MPFLRIFSRGLIMTLQTSSVASISPIQSADLLLVDPSPEAAALAATLKSTYRVAATGSADVAKQFLRRYSPAVVVTELDLQGSDGIEICREAKLSAAAPPVLVTTAATERVPDALVAGCDGVLLKPFAPNLLYARIGRLLRARGEALRERAKWQRAKAAFLIEHSQRVLTGTNIVWPDAYCPSCGKGDLVSFDAASYRRMWYACLPCRKVWMATKREVQAPRIVSGDGI